MNDTRSWKKDRRQHIQVFIRIRPINNTEKAGRSSIVVDAPTNKEVVVRERPHDKFTKKFTFDRVFGSHSKQIDVYNVVVSPLLEEVLSGYNCTVFAYGQTGTGKTFTMEGVDKDPSLHWQKDTNAGIIPRALSHLFDELKLSGVQEYSVRVSYLELYNEEVFDLLSASDDAAKIRIYEDSTKKGGVIVHGLEEIIIHNKTEVFKILQKGSEKRQTAPTLMNANSSRSHTIFSITVHIKENTIDGEELLKTGKLNLVDLAGSENVARSGSVDKRAREAGSINQSLLTLGRVITALVEKTPHIPYRESKLTRLLQESLGGRTRTSIIATVSPASINLEESLSTLDYAHRAKNITNKPEVNQKFSKKALLQEYTEEIERLRKDLLASRGRNGVYLAPDNYNEMQSLIEYQSKEIQEKLNHIKALEEAMGYKEQIFTELQSKNTEQANELLNAKNQLETTRRALVSTSSRLVVSEQEMEEQKHLVEKHASTENVLLSQVETVLNVADTATSDVYKLHDKVFRKMQIGQTNSYLGQQVKNNVKEYIKNIEADVSMHADDLTQFFTSIKSHIEAHTDLLNECIEKSIKDISKKLVNSKQNTTEKLTKDINDSYLRYEQWLDKEMKNVTTMTDQECSVLDNISQNLAPKIQQLIENKVAENLRALNNNISRKIDNLAGYTETTVASMSKCLVEEYDILNNNVQDIRGNIEGIRRSQNSICEKRANFAKMMKDLQHCFNELQEEDEETHTSIRDTLSSVDEVCCILNNEASDTCKISVEQENKLYEKLHRDLYVVKQVVADETEKSWTLADNAVAKAKVFVRDFQTDLIKNCNTLNNYKKCMERNIREMQQKMKDDRSLILSSINDVYMAVYNASIEHAKCLNDCKAAFVIVSSEMNRKLENESANAGNANCRIITEMQAIRDRVDKFFVDDLYRDIPTGSTPAKKDFHYSKKLTKTSPHDRILKRFRETLNDIDSDENEPMSVHDTTLSKETLNII